MGGSMIVRGVKLRAVTERGDFGFAYTFAPTLTIIRGSNSSGKSTLFNSLLYGMGMEEIIGGKGERSLPYAVKDYIEFENTKIHIAASEVFLELENAAGRIVTLRRSIRDSTKDSKLIEIYESANLSQGQELGAGMATYLHDAGGAQRREGFHRFLETFLGLSLPQVPTTSSSECKLYLQTVFAALAVEQKRGWTDYIANIPFFGIRDARTRVVEYLLGLNVFETNAARNRLNAESMEIDAEWRKTVGDLQREIAARGAIIEGVPAGPSALFDRSTAQLKRMSGKFSITLADYIAALRDEYDQLRARAEQVNRASGEDALKEIDKTSTELQELSLLYERSTAALGVQKASANEYEKLLSEAQEDLERNKTAAKLRELGARHEVELATGRCPTCHQPVEDTLLRESITGPQMDLAMNIGYLESQTRMLRRQINGLREGIGDLELRVVDLSTRLAAKHDHLNALRGDMSSGASESKAVVRRQVQIEIEVEGLEKLPERVGEILSKLDALAKRLAANQAARKGLPKSAYTSEDDGRVALFEKMFRANAGSFGYESAPIQDIEISRDALVPCLSQLELREIRTDIKSDSSASDFVRLIWSYLLALHQTSSHQSAPGNHPGILLLDEPGQHSMAVDSQHALLQHLAGEAKLQSIVAASFDESEEVFQQATIGVKHKLIQWDGKLMRPL